MESVTLDKLTLKAFDYHQAASHSFTSATVTAHDGKLIGTRQYFNEKGKVSINLEADKQGIPAVFVTFNPNNTSHQEAEGICNKAGLSFDMVNSLVLRADFERTMQLQHPALAYHGILHQAASGKVVKASFNDTLNIGTASLQIGFYDKGKQIKSPLVNLTRMESRYKKPGHLRKHGIFTLADLYDSDFEALYKFPMDCYLQGLKKEKESLHDIGSSIRILEHLYKTSNRPLQAFLIHEGLGNIGLESMLDILDSLTISKQQKYRAKQFVRKQGQLYGIGKGEGMVKEILSFFEAA